MSALFIGIFLIWTEVPFKQEVSGVYTFFSRYRLTEDGFAGPKVFGAFKANAQGGRALFLKGAEKFSHPAGKHSKNLKP